MRTPEFDGLSIFFSAQLYSGSDFGTLYHISKSTTVHSGTLSSRVPYYASLGESVLHLEAILESHLCPFSELMVSDLH